MIQNHLLLMSRKQSEKTSKEQLESKLKAQELKIQKIDAKEQGNSMVGVSIFKIDVAEESELSQNVTQILSLKRLFLLIKTLVWWLPSQVMSCRRNRYKDQLVNELHKLVKRKKKWLPLVAK